MTKRGIAVALGAGLCIAAAPSATVKLTESGQARVGAAAPSFGGWSLDGTKVITLDALRRTGGMAPLLITFGASWCTACAEGLPRLKKVAERHPELRLVLIDVESDARKAQEFAARHGVDRFALLDKFETVARAYGVSGAQGANGAETTSLPRTFLIDVAGKVRAIYREEGSDLEQLLEADLEAAKTAVRPAAAAK